MQASKLQSGITVRLGWLMGCVMALVPWLVTSPAQAAKPQNHQAAPRTSISAPRSTASASVKPVSSRGVTASRGMTLSRGTARGVALPGKRGGHFAKGGKGARVAGYGGGLQCVPFARSASGIEVSGNAHLWWDNAAGIYARGQVPERGSVMSFKANSSMPLGHVAVVSRVINARMVEIDHANWAGPGGRKGSVARGVSVVDVSDANNWSAVRVALGNSGDYGSIYPANGFIYDRPDTGRIVTAAARAPMSPMPELNAAPRDLRPDAGQNSGYASVSFAGGAYEEVAEAPATSRRSFVSPRRKPAKVHH